MRRNSIFLAVVIPLFATQLIAQEVLSPERVIQKVADKLASVKHLGYTYRFNYSVPSQNRSRVAQGVAFLDLKSAEEQVQTATRARELADLQLTQARDRFAAGVASNLEVVQAQEAVAGATEGYISALYDLNIAKAMVLGSPGSLEQAIEAYLGTIR